MDDRPTSEMELAYGQAEKEAAVKFEREQVLKYLDNRISRLHQWKLETQSPSMAIVIDSLETSIKELRDGIANGKHLEV